jgi:hypothetical protein
VEKMFPKQSRIEVPFLQKGDLLKVIFTDLNNRSNNKEYQTSSKELTISGVIRVLRANVPVIAASAEAIVQTGTWTNNKEWKSPSGQYCVELVKE